MSLIFSIIGFVILGFLIRAFFNDKSIEGNSKDKSNGLSTIFQIIISLIIGFVVWSSIPQNCKGNSEKEYNGRYYE